MDYTGLIRKFPNDRPLGDFDREHRLQQKKRLDVPLAAEGCVVKMNSNALVLVDRWYAYRGMLALMGLVGVAFGVGMIRELAWALVDGLPNENGLWVAVFISMAMGAALAAAGAWVAGKEMFRWTYYPIALDRKHKLVHVFRLDGTVLTAKWNKLYFTLGGGVDGFQHRTWDVRGLILDPDGVTVRETFAFSSVTYRAEDAYSHWEFLRRYMEDGPQAVQDAVLHCVPADGKPETFALSRQRAFAEDAQGPGFLSLLMMPFNLLHAIMRWAVMHTSKVPAFPPEIEATLQPEPEDEYARDASMNPAYSR